MVDKCCLYIYIYIISCQPFHSYKERKGEEGEKVKHEENPQNYHFWTYLYNISIITFWCMLTSIGSRLVTPS